MAWFKRSKGEKHGGGTATAVAEPPVATEPLPLPDEPLRGAPREELWAEIARLEEQNRATPDRATERRILRLRHLVGADLLEHHPAEPRFPEPGALPEGDPLPEIAREDLTPELLRAGILRDGCLLVRGLVPREDALALADEIDRSFVEREKVLAGEPAEPGYYEELVPEPRFVEDPSRGWIREGGGVLAADAPKLAFAMLELFRAGGLPELMEAYLGEPAAISLEKTTLRKAEPTVGGAWHQDGKFMGPVRAMNLWLSLSRCGDLAPGLDLVPRRLDDYVQAGGPGAFLDYQVTDRTAREAAAPKEIVRPIFEPGDALLFDERFLHQTGSDASMPNPRYAVESWFFGGSAFPSYSPIAV